MEIRPRRRAHRKSRSGCQTCKQRHVRCDETVPRCLKCIKGNRLCEYTQTDHHESSGTSTSALIYQEDVTSVATKNELPDFNDPGSSTCHFRTITADIESTGSIRSLDPFGSSLIPMVPRIRDRFNYCKDKSFYLFSLGIIELVTVL